MRDLLSPSLDFVFKSLFALPANKDMLISLLSAVLRPASPIRDVTVLNPELPKTAASLRALILDLHAVLDDRREVDVEMPTLVPAGTRPRSLYHWSRVFSEQLVPGGTFVDLRPCVAIFILARPALPWRRLHSTFRVLEIHNHQALCDDLEVHFVELSKLGYGRAENNADLLDWSTFLACRDEAAIDAAARRNPMIAKARSELVRLSADKKARYLARKREEYLLMQQFEKAEARRQGIQEGIEQGIEQGNRQLLTRQLRVRFGELPAWAEHRVLEATASDIDRWAERILTASTVEEALSR